VLMTSTGRLLEGDAYDSTTNGIDMVRGLKQVLDAYDKLPVDERRARNVDGEVKPQRAPPTNGLVLTIFDRPIARSQESGEMAKSGCGYRHPEGQDFEGFRTHAPHGQRSSLWLTEEECKSLIPSDPQVGRTHDVPANLAKRIWLYGLVPQTLWVVEETWRPNSVQEGNLQLTVEAATEQKLRLRVSGSVLLTGPSVLHTWPERQFIKNIENRYDARLEGILEVDLPTRQIIRLDMVALGDYTGRWFAGENGWKEATPSAPLPLGFAFEIDKVAYQLPPERRRPRSFIHAYIFQENEDHYWDPEKWLIDWQQRQQAN